MNDLEAKLKDLPLVKPSPGLRKRIFGSVGNQDPRGFLMRRRIPLAWAAALAIIAAAGGFFAARVMDQDSVPPTSLRVKIIDPVATRSMFDFSSSSDGFLKGEINVRIEKKDEA